MRACENEMGLFFSFLASAFLSFTPRCSVIEYDTDAAEWNTGDESP